MFHESILIPSHGHLTHGMKGQFRKEACPDTLYKNYEPFPCPLQIDIAGGIYGQPCRQPYLEIYPAFWPAHRYSIQGCRDDNQQILNQYAFREDDRGHQSDLHTKDIQDEGTYDTADSQQNSC